MQPPQPESETVITLGDVRTALALPGFDALSAQMRMSPQPRPFRRAAVPGTPKLAAVLILLFPVKGVLTFVLMRRTEYEGVHSGQISLPGGKREDGETFEQTAIRETYEELGVSDAVSIIGPLTPLHVPPSDFEIHPFVGYLPSAPVWQPDPGEVAAVIESPLQLLLDEQVKGMEDTTRYGRPFTIPFYRVGDVQVWGATAIILSEFEARLQIVLAAR